MAGTDKRCTFFGKNWLNLTGRTLEQEIGNGWAEGIHADDYSRSLDCYVSAFDQRQVYTMEYRLHSASGEYRWVLDSGVPHVSPSGEFLGYICTAIDITERKLAEDQFRQVIEAAQCDDHGESRGRDSPGQCPCGGRLRLRARGADRPTLRMPRSRILSHAVAEVRRKYFEAPQARCADVGRKLFGQRKDGACVPIEVVLDPVSTSHGTFALVSITDITARLQGESEAIAQRQEVAHLSRVAMLGELSGSLAHELNQPLTAILSNAEAARRFLSQQPANLQEVKEILDDIVRDDHRAGEVIRRLRMLFRKGELQLNDTDINQTIRDVLKLVNSDLLNHSVLVQPDLQDGLPSVSADRVQLQQVLLNLIMNACDAMADTRVPNRQLTVRTAADDEGKIEVSVADQGCGIASSRLEQVFEPFFTTKSKGMGLGLTVCRTIVSAHGGKLWATSNGSGRGAYISRCLASGHYREPLMNTAEPTVFLVDDDASVLKAISRLLRGGGFNVITYDSPRKFLEHCNGTMPGCAVLDVAMPGLDGLKLQEELAAKGAALPIIFLSGQGDIPMSVQAMRRGAIDFLTKPVRKDDLEAAVRTAIERDQSQRLVRAELNDIQVRLAALTPREHEVLEHVIAGHLNKEAAAELGVAEKTVKVHRARVMGKMRVQSVAELVHLAERAGINAGRASLLD